MKTRSPHNLFHMLNGFYQQYTVIVYPINYGFGVLSCVVVVKRFIHQFIRYISLHFSRFFQWNLWNHAPVQTKQPLRICVSDHNKIKQNKIRSDPSTSIPNCTIYGWINMDNKFLQNYFREKYGSLFGIDCVCISIELLWVFNANSDFLQPPLQFGWLVQEIRNSIANALELRLSCTNP